MKTCAIHEGKYGRYFQVNYARHMPFWFFDPAFEPMREVEILHVNAEVYPADFGPFRFGGGFRIKPDPEGIGHPRNDPGGMGETILFLGTDPAHPDQLGAEIDLCMEAERRILTKTSVVAIPQGMLYGPVRFKSVSRPVIRMAVACAPTYCQRRADGLQGEPAIHRNREGGHGKYIFQNPKPPVTREDGTIEVIKIARDDLLADMPPVEIEYLIRTAQCGAQDGAFRYDTDVAVAVFDPDPGHARELGAELRVPIGDEVHLANEPFILTVPAGIAFGPITFLNVKRPVVQITARPLTK